MVSAARTPEWLIVTRGWPTVLRGCLMVAREWLIVVELVQLVRGWLLVTREWLIIARE